MPTISEFFTKFGWPEFWMTFLIVFVIVFIREKHHFFKKHGGDKTHLESKE